jgi:DNA-binding PadR family transcriptional regulator
MARRAPHRALRPLSDAAYLVLGYVAMHADGVHGYRLGAMVSRSPLALPWLRLGQLYRILGELAARGLLEKRVEIGTSRPARVLFTASVAGRAAFRRWLASPARGGTPVREQLLHRLRFAELIPEATLRRMIRDAAQECEIELRELEAAASRPLGGGATALIVAALGRRLAADRSWLAEAGHLAPDGLSVRQPAAAPVRIAGGAIGPRARS